MKTVIYFFSFLFFSIVSVSKGQGFTASQIDSLVNKSMEMMPQVGIAVAVIENGKIIHQKGYGQLAIDSDERVDEHTLFQIASNTKAFTAAGLTILVDQGKLDWDDRVIQHIPEFTMYNDYVRENFTIVDLLTHRSGLGLGAGDLMFFPSGSDFTIEDVLNNFQFLKPTSDFRTKYDYDNLLYQVAGEVISRVSQQSYDLFIESHILNPLGMDRSGFEFSGLKDKDNVAAAHATDHGEIRKIDRFVSGEGSLLAAGGIYSSVYDMSKWLLAQINEGKYGDSLENRIFSAERQSEMWRPYTMIGFNLKPSPSYRWHFGAYGLGWFIVNINNFSVLSHSGGLPGMLSMIMMVPELNSAVVVLTNGAPGGNSYGKISSAITDEWTKRKRWDYLTNTKEQLARADAWVDSTTNAAWQNAKVSNLEELKAEVFLGTYEDKWFGRIKIENREGKLWFQSERSPLLNGEMFYYKKDAFIIKMSYTDMLCDAFAYFEMDESGNPNRLKMAPISPDVDFSFDYQDLDLIRVKE